MIKYTTVNAGMNAGRNWHSNRFAAVALKSVRTQTRTMPAGQATSGGPKFAPAQLPVQYISIDGQRVPVAIALGPPRQGGTKEAIVIKTGSTKADHENKKLEVKILPSVEIDSESSEFKKKKTVLPERTRLEKMVHETRDRQLNDIPDTGDIIGEGMTLPGYHPPTPEPYMGPVYPPEGVESKYPIPEDSSARELAEQLRQKDLLNNKARDWIEQELMARLLLERQRLREERSRDPVSHRVTSRSPQTPLEDETVRALNNRGMQLFVDSGLPVNEGLVKKFIIDVVKERLRHTLGTNRKPGQKQATSPRKTTSPRSLKSREGSKKDELVNGSLNVSSINSSPPKIMSPLDANNTARSSMVTESESESTNELAAIWGKKPVLTIEEEENSVVHYSQKRDDTPAPSGSEVWDYEDDFAHTPQSERQRTVSQAPSTPSTPGATPKKKADQPEQEPEPDPVRQTAGDVRVSVMSREPSPPMTRSLTSSSKKKSPKRTPKPEMDEIAVQTEFPLSPAPAPASPAPSSISGSSTMVSDTFNESLSEGEWLISHSEGQAPDIDPVRKAALLQYLREDEPSIAISVDIPQEEYYQGFLNRSVGEFIRPRDTTGHQSDLLGYLSQVRPPLHPLFQFSRPSEHPSSVQPRRGRRLETQKSLGELITEGEDTYGGKSFGELVAEGDLLLEENTLDDDPLRLSELGRAQLGRRPDQDSYLQRPSTSYQSTPVVNAKSSDTQARMDDDLVVDAINVDDDVASKFVHARIIHVRSSQDDGGIDDTMRNVQGTLASSLGQVDFVDSRADIRTPDQMNLEHLKAGYLAQTQSDSEYYDHRISERETDERLVGESQNLSAVRSSLGETGQFTITESYDETSEAEQPVESDGRMVVRMPSAGHQSETETAEDISEMSIP